MSPSGSPVDGGGAVEEDRQVTRAQVSGEQPQRVGDPGVFYLADQGYARKVIFHPHARLFSMRTRRRPQSLTLDERDC